MPRPSTWPGYALTNGAAMHRGECEGFASTCVRVGSPPPPHTHTHTYRRPLHARTCAPAGLPHCRIAASPRCRRQRSLAEQPPRPPRCV
eukprot:365752-Chlamydomonas_euryale.AAC.4